jgi:ATP phosphoribosyltransferase
MMPNHPVPTYEDATLVLKLYELRREEKLRAARDWFGGKFFPQTVQDVTALTGTENAYYRMVTSYWEMAASFVVRGILNTELFLDSGGEMIFVWAKLADLVRELRQNLGSENLLKNVESVIESSPRAKERVGVTRQRIAQVRERALAAVAKA